MRAPTGPMVSINKGTGLLDLAEQIRISPAPKLGGAAGPHLRFLSAARNQSTITDLEVGSLSPLRRVTGLPLMHRMWFEPEGHSLGYTKKRKLGSPSELYFLDAEGRVSARGILPDAASEVASAPGCWYVGCRDGALYAFSLEGRRLWRHAIPFERRSYGLASPMLELFTAPYLFVGSGAGSVIVAEGRRLYAIDPLGRRLWSSSVPHYENRAGAHRGPGALPTREQTLETLGLSESDTDLDVRTGYLRLSLDTGLHAGFLKQVELYDVPDIDLPEREDPEEGNVELVIDSHYGPADCRAMACAATFFCVGTQNGTAHVFDGNASLMQSFQVGDAPVSQVVADGEGLRAAYAGGRLTLLRRGRVTGSVTLPEYFAELMVCGDYILVWRWQSAWLVNETGRVVWAATAERRITSAINARGRLRSAGRSTGVLSGAHDGWVGSARGPGRQSAAKGGVNGNGVVAGEGLD